VSNWISVWAVPSNKITYIPAKYKIDLIGNHITRYIKVDKQHLLNISYSSFYIILRKNHILIYKYMVHTINHPKPTDTEIIAEILPIV